MGLQKGHTNNPNGRPKGAKNSRTKEWESLGDSIVSRHAERFNNALDSLDDAAFIRAYTSVLAYFRPKLSSTQLEIEEQKREKDTAEPEMDYSKLKDQTLLEMVELFKKDGDISRDVDINDLSFESLIDLVRGYKKVG